MATAARALGGYGYVSPATKEQVQEAARRLGYQPNDVARSMRAKTTKTIGFVGADISNPFFATAMRGVSDVARRHGFEVFLTNSDEQVQLERQAVRALLGKQVDGIVLAPTVTDDVAHLRSVVDSGTPLVFIDRTLAGIPADSVCIDNLEAARIAVDHLLRLGHRRIALVAEGPEPYEPGWTLEPRQDVIARPSIARAQGYLRAHHDAGVPVDPELAAGVSGYSKDAARDEVRRVLALPERPTALFASDNIMALGAVAALREAAVDVPGEMSLVVFDDLDWTTVVNPAVTVVEQPVYELGVAAAERLLARINGDESAPTRVELQARLLERGSCAPVRADGEQGREGGAPAS